ncbi:hypothetical protein [Singulisphaera sp. GP187]|uniref:hypothetical protein n=1 Tax=Singulisphaera sp. GP187 TaxID=1882752 RepID=UPI0020B173B2|nr:hypothetical protein [Singulisphaera sp. GP187]
MDAPINHATTFEHFPGFSAVAGDFCGEGMMGIRRFGLLAVLALFAMVPSLAMARGYGRSGGTINTPFGSMNTNSPEYKMAGGNPYVYQELMEEKMLMQQQMMMLKQQQQYMKQMQKNAKNNKGNTNLQPVTPVSTVTSLAPRKKKKKKSVTAVKSAFTTATSSNATSTAGAKASSASAATKP